MYEIFRGIIELSFLGPGLGWQRSMVYLPL